MIEFIWLIPALPFLGFLLLALWGGRMSRPVASLTGVGTVGIAALLSLATGVHFLTGPPATGSFRITLWKWMEVSGFDANIGLYIDQMTVIFLFVITFVGFFIHLYSVEFMKEDEGFARFFAYMNLFVGSMLTLVMADNLLLLYLGWEGVGLCSFLLIGFWYKDPANGYAARKAFIVTRVGDTAMAIGLFLLVMHFNTLEIQSILGSAAGEWPVGSGLAVAVALLLLGGAVGKSAQLPLQTWLPDAMAGPSPVSALIHAATMVTAGVYLIARTHVLFELAPVVMMIIAIIGATTLLVSGFSALFQHDIKRVLAYSTISQIGYMFLALGVGAWSAAIFHFMIHAFFKALLFLGAGAVIMVLHHEHNMFKMGGLRKQLPVTFWTFLIASASLAALPLVTAGFYSKDAILWFAYSSPGGSIWLWLAGLAGAFVTAIYTFRMVFLTFFGNATQHITHRPGWKITVPLVVLAVLSLFGGFIELPATLGGLHLFSGWLEQALPEVSGHASIGTELIVQLIAAAAAIGGILIAWAMFYKKPQPDYTPPKNSLGEFLYRGWQFDGLYDRLFVFPFVWLAKINKRDVVDQLYDFLAWITGQLHYLFRNIQTGRLRWYAMSIVLGVIITLSIILLL